MKKPLLLASFLILNTIAAFAAFDLWNSSSMAAGAVAIVLFAAGGLGTFLGGYLAAKTLYGRPFSQWFFGAAATAAFLGVAFCAFLIQHPHGESGPFPTHPWHEHGFTWIYLVISTLWMLVQATRTK